MLPVGCQSDIVVPGLAASSLSSVLLILLCLQSKIGLVKPMVIRHSVTGEKTMRCTACREKVSANAKICPHCGKNVPSSYTARDWVFAAIFGLIFFVLLRTCEPTEEEKATDAAQTADDRRQGLHCLSGWDGSHRAFKQDMERRMKDPDSFEHITTRVTPVRDGVHFAFMKYRAKNSFGGYMVGTAKATYRNDNCKHTIVSIE